MKSGSSNTCICDKVWRLSQEAPSHPKQMASEGTANGDGPSDKNVESEDESKPLIDSDESAKPTLKT